MVSAEWYWLLLLLLLEGHPIENSWPWVEITCVPFEKAYIFAAYELAVWSLSYVCITSKKANSTPIYVDIVNVDRPKEFDLDEKRTNSQNRSRTKKNHLMLYTDVIMIVSITMTSIKECGCPILEFPMKIVISNHKMFVRILLNKNDDRQQIVLSYRRYSIVYCVV